MVLYLKVENKIINKKTILNSFLFYYKVKNKLSLKHFYYKLYFMCYKKNYILYFRVVNRVELKIPL